MTAGEADQQSGEGEVPFRLLGSAWAPPPSYPSERLMEEVAFIAYHFHWPMEQILEMEHSDRRQWAEEISRINDRMNEEGSALSSMTVI